MTRRTLLAWTFGIVASRAAAESPQDHAAWWIANYGVLDAKDERVARAESVFARLAAVAEKNSRRPPSLRVLRAAAGPLALALPDGTVLLTQEGLELCYRDAARGDARLAFVLGHELAHLGRDDFWHSFAPPDGRAADTRRRMTSETAAQAQAKELQADAYGAIYLSLAGYSPADVFGQSGSFLETWIAQTGGASGPKPHPSASRRARNVRRQLGQVVRELDFFSFGVRLYQLGRYEDALVLLSHFNELYPGREVLNGIGLAHLQLALRALAACAPDDAVRYRLPVSVDVDTLARRIHLRGGPTCLDDRPFLQRATEALRHFRAASARDESYLPARINASSVLLLMGNPANALAEAEEALKRAPDDAAALNNKALALHQYGLAQGMDTVDTTLDLLGRLRQAYPDDPVPAYNLAVVLKDRGRLAAAQSAWEGYLRLEPAGAFADVARAQLELPAPPAPGGAAQTQQLPAPDIPLGRVGPATARKLEPYTKSDLDTGVFRCVIYRTETVSVLEIDRSIEVVETTGMGLSEAELLARLGRPSRVEAAGPIRTLVYLGHAFDVVEGQVVRSVYFSS